MKRKVDYNTLVNRLKTDLDTMEPDALCTLLEYMYATSNVSYNSDDDVIEYETIEEFEHIDDFKDISEPNE